MTALPRISDIQAAVAKRYRVPLSVMREPSRRGGNQRVNAWPRQVAMTLAVRLTNHSYPSIGKHFGHRDHATVYYACRAVEARRKKNPKLHHSLRQLTFALVRR